MFSFQFWELSLSLASFSSTYVPHLKSESTVLRINSGLGVCGRGGVWSLINGLELCRKVGAVSSTVSRGVWEAQPQSCPGRAGLGKVRLQGGGDEQGPQEHRERRRTRGTFSVAHEGACLWGRGKHKTDHWANSYIALSFHILVRSVKREREGDHMHHETKP